MNENVRKMVKNVIEENAVDFKKSASKALYEKVGDKLKQQYIAVSQNLLKKKVNENVNFSAGVSNVGTPVSFGSSQNLAAQYPNFIAQTTPPGSPGQTPPTGPGRKGRPPQQQPPRPSWPPYSWPPPPLWDRPDTFWVDPESIPEPDSDDYFPDWVGPDDPPSMDDFPHDPNNPDDVQRAREAFQRAMENWRKAKEAWDRDQRRREQYLRDRDRYFRDRWRQIKNRERGRGPSRLRNNPRYRENNPAYGIPGLPSDYASDPSAPQTPPQPPQN